MARSVNINHPRKRHQQRRREQGERPVLQLPLEAPQWRDPPTPERREQIDQGGDRGVAVVDFFI